MLHLASASAKRRLTEMFARPPFLRLCGVTVFALGTWSAMSIVGGCGSSDSDNQPSVSSDLDASVPPPTRAEYGLDSRPANPTCVAPDRPPSASPVKFEQVYANVSLVAPMMIA